MREKGWVAAGGKKWGKGGDFLLLRIWNETVRWRMDNHNSWGNRDLGRRRKKRKKKKGINGCFSVWRQARYSRKSNAKTKKTKHLGWE